MRWFEATPLEEITAEVVLDCFVSSWISRFGLPAHVTIDRGAQFTSSTWSTWCTEMQVDHITTTAFHPQANDMVERLHWQLKDALRARGAASAWEDHLPWVFLGLHAAPKDESGLLAAEAALGQPLVIPGQPTALEGTVPAALHAAPVVIPATSRGGSFTFSSGFSRLGLHAERASWNSSCRQVRGPLPRASMWAEVLQDQDGGVGGHC